MTTTFDAFTRLRHMWQRQSGVANEQSKVQLQEAELRMFHHSDLKHSAGNQSIGRRLVS